MQSTTDSKGLNTYTHVTLDTFWFEKCFENNSSFTFHFTSMRCFVFFYSKIPVNYIEVCDCNKTIGKEFKMAWILLKGAVSGSVKGWLSRVSLKSVTVTELKEAVWYPLEFIWASFFANVPVLAFWWNWKNYVWLMTMKPQISLLEMKREIIILRVI